MGGQQITVLSITYVSDKDRYISAIKIAGQVHTFAYIGKNPSIRLSEWNPSIGRKVFFSYSPPTQVLSSIRYGEKADTPVLIKLDSVLAPQPSGAKSQGIPSDYWLVNDGQFTYTYGTDPRTRAWVPNQITQRDVNGYERDVDYSPKRGILTVKDRGVETKTCYYVAPGQLFDGKVRRVEVDGRLKVEYRYARRTGGISEIVGENGIIECFENDPTTLRRLGGPLPIRMYRCMGVTRDIILTFVYDKIGRLVTSTDAMKYVIQRTYNSRGELVSITNPSGTVTSYTYDDFGRCNSIVANGVTEQFTHDGVGRLVSQVKADNIHTTFEYDKHGLLLQVTQNDNLATKYVYDQYGFLIGQSDALGRTKSITRDNRGNIIAEIAPNGTATRYEYDNFDRRIAQMSWVGHNQPVGSG